VSSIIVEKNEKQSHFVKANRLLDDSTATAYVADWRVQLEKGAPHEVKDHSVEVRKSWR
jgi:hypothetical protein